MRKDEKERAQEARQTRGEQETQRKSARRENGLKWKAESEESEGDRRSASGRVRDRQGTKGNESSLLDAA
jgi:hypothetical protein